MPARGTARATVMVVPGSQPVVVVHAPRVHAGTETEAVTGIAPTVAVGIGRTGRGIPEVRSPEVHALLQRQQGTTRTRTAAAGRRSDILQIHRAVALFSFEPSDADRAGLTGLTR